MNQPAQTSRAGGDRPPSVLHVLGTLAPSNGGPITTTKGQIRLAIERGWKVTVIARHSGSGLDDLAIPTHVPSNAVQFCKQAAELMRNHDVVHIHGLYRLHTYAPGLAAKRSNIRLVVEPHGSLTDYHWRRRRLRKVGFEKVLDGPLLRRADAVIVASEMERAQLQRRFSGKVVLVPHYLPPGRTGSSAARRSGVLFLGRITEKKRLDLLIDAWPSVLEACPNTHLTIAGPSSRADLRRVRQHIDSLTPSNRGTIRVIGPQYGGARDDLYASHRVFSLPSEDENFGNTVIEAALAGLQIHTTAMCGATEYLPSDPDALCITETAVHAISEGISGLLTVPDYEREAAVDGTRSELVCRLSADEVWSRLVSAYCPARKVPDDGC